jgi:hypothetical protein
LGIPKALFVLLCFSPVTAAKLALRNDLAFTEMIGLELHLSQIKNRGATEYRLDFMRSCHRPGIIRTALFAGVLAAALGCGPAVEGQVDGFTAAAGARRIASLYRDVPGEIESAPLMPRPASTGNTLFEALDAKAIGIDFFHRWNEELGQNRNTATGSGVTIGDYDGDALADVFLPRTTDGGRLFRNRGGFHFEDVTEQAGIGRGERLWTLGASFVDIDNDGDLDLFVCGYRCANRLYINRGDGTFEDRAPQFGLDFLGASIMMAFADYDLDGDLDGYLVTNHHPPPADIEYRLVYDTNGVPRVPEQFREFHDTLPLPEGDYGVIEVGQYDRLYRNNGDGTFTNVANEAGITGNHKGLGVIWWDYNQDRFPDIYVANDFFGPDRLYRNNGDGTFTDVAAQALPHTPWFSMGCDTGDINNDGLADLIATDMSERTAYRAKVAMDDMYDGGWFLERPTPRQYMRNAVFLNTGAGRLLEIAHLAGLESTDWTWSPRFADLDQDGRLDLYVTNGMSRDWSNTDMEREAMRRGPNNSEAFDNYWNEQPPLKQRNYAFRNQGDLRFDDVSQAWGLDKNGISFGAAFGDLDGDGDLDLVVNNLSDTASVYRNNGAAGRAVKIRLQGRQSNHWGIGATVRVRAGRHSQSGYLTLSRGFMSASEPIIHFGVGNASVIDELDVEWPGGERQSFADLPVDRLYTITEPAVPASRAGGESASVAPASRAGSESASARPTYFARRGDLIPLTHRERPFDDFAREPLLAAKLSQLGPGLAVGDVNGDGLEDFFLGGAAGNPGSIAMNQGGGKWAVSQDLFPPWSEDTNVEDQGTLLFDADGDSDMDLLLVSGGVECEPDDEALRDRLFINDGKGSFQRAPADALPDLRDSGSACAAADFDRDGDLDLFIGSRCVPGRYPETPTSRLLRNDGGRFRDVTSQVAPPVAKSGLVTSALWSNANGDGWIDLVVTHEWGPIKLFLNDKGRLEDATHAAGLSELLGWWQGLAGRDLDGDGDIDYVATNLGRNTSYRVSAKRRAMLFYGRFAGDDEKPVLIEAKYDEQGRLIPTRNKPEFERAVPSVEVAYPSFHEFASATLEEIVGGSQLANAMKLEANFVDSVVLRNDGRGRFTVEPLPILAQVSPGFGVVMSDFNASGHTDVYLVQNLFSTRREIGRWDGGASALMLGNEKGQLTIAPARESGLLVPEDAKSVVLTDLNGDRWPDLVVGVNDGDVIAFEHLGGKNNRITSVQLKGQPGNPTAVGARITVVRSDGLRQTAEVQAGGGYLSQQSATLWFGLGPTANVASVEVHWPDGKSSRHAPNPNESEILIEQPGRNGGQ